MSVLDTSRPVLVTGGLGFIGYHTIHQLLLAKVPVVTIDNFDNFYDRAAKQKNLRELTRLAQEHSAAFQFTELDIRQVNAGSFKEISFQAIIHLAAKAGVRPSFLDPQEYYSVNVSGTVNLLEFCRLRKVPIFLFGSSSSVYGNGAEAPFKEESAGDGQISPYASTKRAAELATKVYSLNYGLRVANLRFFSVYGPRQRPDLLFHKLAKAVVTGEAVPLFGDGKSLRDYTHVTDIVSGVMGALQWGHRTPYGSNEMINLGSKNSVSVNEVVALISKHMGGKVPTYRAEAQQGDVERTCADTTKANRLLRYTPKVSLNAGIAQFCTWFLSDLGIPDLVATPAHPRPLRRISN